MKTVFCLSICLAVGALYGLESAQAQKNAIVQAHPVQNPSEWRPHFGLLVGATQPESSGVTAAELGFDVGYQPYIPFAIGAEFTHSRLDDGVSSQDRNTLLAKGSYNFGGSTVIIKDSYVGLGLGAVFKPDGTSLVMAPLVGFDLPIIDRTEETFTVGLAMKYAMVDSEVDALSLSGVLKYWY